MKGNIRCVFRIEGIVQGVGFRPFVYGLCAKYHLKGYVLNNALGVVIDIEGLKDTLYDFEIALMKELPPLARIDFIAKEELPLVHYDTFEIHQSDSTTSKYSLVSPDMSLCAQCLSELEDPQNRRHNYFFINCTNCGPRYSIVKTVPYDRPNTSMEPFIMCKECQNEYDNPLNRRYHAQPISCVKCGPTLELKNINGEVLAYNQEAIERIAMLIDEGNIVAMKGMGGFHLMCDASCDKAVLELRKRKNRPTKPFAVMFQSIDAIFSECKIQEAEQKEIISLLRPIVLLKRNKRASSISCFIAPHIDRLGVFLPYTPLHVMLFKYLHHPIVATSANRSGEPIITDARDIVQKLEGVVDFYLDYNRSIVNPSDDSVLQMIGECRIMMRASRGMAPRSFRVDSKEERKILAIGAHQKNAIAIYLNHQVILSPYIGDLDTIASFELFEQTMDVFKSFYNFEPDLIVGDLHPNYASTKWAKTQNKPFIQVQHHYAHILSAMFEHHLDEKVLGIAWDGTGYGDDGTIWGGEFLVCDTHSYERVAYFEPFSLLGGDASIKDIRRILLSILFDLGKDGVEITSFEAKELKFLKQVHEKKINSPLCSSVGRLFDAVAVLCGMDEKVSYDGESGLLIEGLYDETLELAYPIFLDGKIIRYKHIFEMMLEDKKPRIIATKFINALANIACEISKHYELKTVLCGGVFQNRMLMENIVKKTSGPLYFPQDIPINDGGICVGQLYKILSK